MLVLRSLNQVHGGNMKFSKKKAFTLTELLVVVIVVGVLAAVAVPKFTRVLETRRTTEAEEMLTAVRTEQEKRCSLGQKYAGDFADIPTVAYAKTGNVAEAKSANYTYTLTRTGVNASRPGKDYVIRMPSYKNGQLCCEGSDCASLNKSYALCSEIEAVEDECAADVCEITPNSCACSKYAQANQCECAPSTETCCSDGEVYRDGNCLSMCEAYPSTENCCQDGEVYADGQCQTMCEASPSTANCCTAEQVAQGMEYNPFGKLGTDLCQCPSPNKLAKDSKTGKSYCCFPDAVYKDGKCMTKCEADPSTANCCTGGQEWLANEGRCECPEGTYWDGEKCTDECKDKTVPDDTTLYYWLEETDDTCNKDIQSKYDCSAVKTTYKSCTDYYATGETAVFDARVYTGVEMSFDNSNMTTGSITSGTSGRFSAADRRDPFASFANADYWLAVGPVDIWGDDPGAHVGWTEQPLSPGGGSTGSSTTDPEKCDGNEVRGANGTCLTLSNVNKAGTCAYITGCRPTPSCAGLTENTLCAYQSGTEWKNTICRTCCDQDLRKTENTDTGTPVGYICGPCKDGYKEVNGVCMQVCAKEGKVSNCVCPEGTENSGGHCCPEGEVWTGSQCGCDEDRVWNGSSCVCPEGQYETSGHCCPLEQKWDEDYGGCADKCALGFISDGNGGCKCGGGAHEYNGKCYICPDGSEWIGSGKCKGPQYKRQQHTCCSDYSNPWEGEISGTNSNSNSHITLPSKP